MRPYIIRPGDYLFQLAHRFRFDADAVWSDARNEALRARRHDPQELAPGDTLYIPDELPTKLDVRRGASNRYQATVPTVEVRFVLREEDRPITDEPFEVRGGPAILKGTTNGDGLVSVSVPVTVRVVELVFPEMRMRVPVLVGGLDPLETDSGVDQRLASLAAAGYTTSLLEHQTERDADERRRRAVAQFQRRYGLPISGTLDAETREALAAAYRGERRPVEEGAR